MKRILSLMLLALCLTIGLLPLSAQAEEIATSGTCGENLAWNLDEATGVLTISGTGDMEDYPSANKSPWYSIRTQINTIVIESDVTSIGDYAFGICTNLTNATIGNSVTSIGDYAFFSCAGLNSVTLGNSVTSIGDYAFEDCAKLESITIPDNVTIIGDSSFRGCAKLTSVAIGNNVTSIGNFSFMDCANLTNVAIPDSVTFIGCSAFENCSNLLSVTFGDSVASIRWNAFENCSSLVSVTIPDSVTAIDQYTFWNCSNLSSVTVGNGVTSIGDSAFGNCTKLTSVTIPNSVNSICDRAFRGCSGLTKVTIGDGVTSIGWNVFEGCTSIVEYCVDEKNGFYSSDNRGVLFNKEKTAIIKAPPKLSGEYVVPASVTSLDGAFSGCSELTSVTIPNSITDLGTHMFYECTSLVSVTIPDTITTIGNYTFYGCCSLEEVIIPDGVTYIGQSAFGDCSSLTYSVIPDGVTAIGHGAFAGCSNMSYVVIPDSVEYIIWAAFSGCKLTDIYYSGSPEQWGAINKEDPFDMNIHYYSTDICEYIPEVTAPTCLKGGYTTYTCKCGYTYTVDEVPATGHSFVDGKCSCGARYTAQNFDGHENIALLPKEIKSLNYSSDKAGSYVLAMEAEDGQTQVPATCVIYTSDGQTPQKIAGERNTYGVYGLEANTMYTIVLENTTDTTLSFMLICTLNPSPKDLSLNINMTESDTMYWNDSIDVRGYGARLYYEPAYAYITDTIWSSSDENVLSIEGTSNTHAGFIVRNTGVTTLTATMKDGTTVSMVLTILNSPEFGEEKNGVEKTITLRNNANYYYFTPKESGYYDFRAWHKYGSVQGEVNYNFFPMTEDCISVTRESYSYHKDYFSSVYQLEAGTKYIVEAHHPYDELLEAVLQIVKTNDPTGADESNPIDINKPTEPEETEPTEPEETNPTEPEATKPTEPEETKPTEPEETKPTTPAPEEPEDVEPTDPVHTHTWSPWVNVLEPTTKEEGVRRRKCTTCYEVEGQTLPKITTQFKDVKERDYFALPVTWAVRDSITNGIAEDRFAPNQDCTRAQVVTFLWRAAGEPEPSSTKNPFKDVKKDDYFYKAVLWAVEEGITNGLSDKSFGPNQVCTRAQVATFLWRDQDQPKATSKNPFKDVKKGEYYYDAVIWAVENGVTTGTSETTFAPNATCTRGQIVTFLYRAIA